MRLRAILNWIRQRKWTSGFALALILLILAVIPILFGTVGYAKLLTPHGQTLVFRDWQDWAGLCEDSLMSSMTFELPSSALKYQLPRWDYGGIKLDLYALPRDLDILHYERDVDFIAVVNRTTGEIALFGENKWFLRRGLIVRNVIYFFDVGDNCELEIGAELTSEGYLEPRLNVTAPDSIIGEARFFDRTTHFGRIGKNVMSGNSTLYEDILDGWARSPWLKEVSEAQKGSEAQKEKEAKGDEKQKGDAPL